MAVDVAALKTALETDPQYDSDVTGGHNGVLTASLNTSNEVLPKRWRSISGDDFLDATAAETFTPAQEERIRTYLQDGRRVPLHKLGVRDWIQANMSAPTIAALRALSQVDGKPSDEFLADEDDVLNLRDVRAAIAQISKARINQPPVLRDPSAPVPKGIIPTDSEQANEDTPAWDLENPH